MPTKAKSGTITTLLSVPQQSVGPFPDNAPFVSSSATFPSGFSVLNVQFSILEADLEDPTKTFFLSIVRDSDSLELAGFSWQGGTVGKDGVTFTNPSFLFSAPDAGTVLHAVLTAPLALTMGVVVTAE